LWSHEQLVRDYHWGEFMVDVLFLWFVLNEKRENMNSSIF